MEEGHLVEREKWLAVISIRKTLIAVVE